MSFLICDEQTSEIRIAPEVKNLDIILNCQKKDKTPDKRHFHNGLKYLYHVYKKDHPFTNLSIKERKIKTSELYLNNQDIKQYDDDNELQEILKLYLSLEYTQNEWTYQKLKIDMDDISQHINEIPMTRDAVIEDNVDLNIQLKCPHCKEEIKMSQGYDVKKRIQIDNSEERMKALKQMLSIQEMKEKFSAIIVREKKLKEHNTEETLLEQNFFNKK